MFFDSLERFIDAQEYSYSDALEEIRNGKKRGHWMWYIFPQIRGLGMSEMAYTYGIKGVAEATEYLNHPVLASRLTEICEALLGLDTTDAVSVLGDIDAMKLRSSMTLFSLASEDGSVFHRVLDKYFDGEADILTLEKAAEFYSSETDSQL